MSSMDYFSIQQIKEYMYYMPGTVLGSRDLSVNKTRQNSIPIRNVFTTCKEGDSYAPEYLLWSYGVFTYFGPDIPKRNTNPIL